MIYANAMPEALGRLRVSFKRHYSRFSGRVVAHKDCFHRQADALRAAQASRDHALILPGFVKHASRIQLIVRLPQ